MNIIKEWKYKLKQVQKDIEDYEKIIKNIELNQDMKSFCLGKLKSRNEYKKLIEETIKELKKD